MFTSWHSYPSVYALGHRALAELLLDPVLVQEKIDGSQFSFGRFDGELRCRSKGAQLNVLAPEPLFARAVDAVGALDLREGWTYRGEYLAKPKHNALAYDRVPRGRVILFDVNDGMESYLPYDALAEEAVRIGLEVVPRLYEGALHDVARLRDLLATTSCLGGQKVEGVVVKNYRRFGPDKKVLMGKFVSEAFKEVHAKEWKRANPRQGDIVLALTERYRTPARWSKARQHLREAGRLDGSPRDIGPLMAEVVADVECECAAEIQERLFTWAWPLVRRGGGEGTVKKAWMEFDARWLADLWGLRATGAVSMAGGGVVRVQVEVPDGYPAEKMFPDLRWEDEPVLVGQGVRALVPTTVTPKP